jgi:hypothetical protein
VADTAADTGADTGAASQANLRPSRRLLIASVPLVLLTVGCRSADLFAGPDPLGGRPPLAHDTIVLQAVIAAELDLISRYKSVMSASQSSLLPVFLGQHQQHLAQLRARLIVPPGAQPSPSETPSASENPSAMASATASAPPGESPGKSSHPIAGLRDAERASAASLTGRLVSVEPSLAQLFASIAASDATHADALGGD